MNTTPKTIQIFLPSGDPRGIRIAEITTRIVQVIEVPRSLLGEFLKMNESSRVAVYFLFGGDEDERKVYIGQTGDLRGRLKAHQSGKEFWERALVLVSRTENMTQTHTLYLEWLCIQQAREAGRYKDENGNSGQKPYTTSPIEAECYEYFETGSTLLSSLGYPLFSAVVSNRESDNQETTVYQCKASGTEGRGLYTPEGFVVLKGSVGRVATVKSLQDTTYARKRADLIASDAVELNGEWFTFLTDQLFSSPSAAANYLTGSSNNGWIDWRTDDGRTLQDVEGAEAEESTEGIDQ